MLPNINEVFAGRLSYQDAIRGIDHAALPTLTDELYNTVEAIIQGMSDGDVTFEPRDAAQEGATQHGWTVGHVIVHLTAGLEEGASCASTLARGVVPEGRPRYETPWETVTVADQVTQRLRESRRMVRAFFDTWPDSPHLEVTYVPIPPLGELNAIGRFLLGIFHGQSHYEQLREIMRQARS